jgi:hypothetical protein
MASELGRRRAEIVSFLKGLSEREKLLVLAYLGNDAGICDRAPHLARTVPAMPRSFDKGQVIQVAAAEASNLDLELLARRKGCRLQRVAGGDHRWRIFGAEDRGVDTSFEEHGLRRNSLTLRQALEALRALPDREVSVKS